MVLIFRSDPYGLPFVSKPDWFIFHAVCIDFLWIINFFAAFAIISLFLSPRISQYFTKFYVIIQSALLLITLLDNEVQRFLGTHLSFGLANTYKDTSSLRMFWEYCASDVSVPFLQFFLLVFLLPLAYLFYILVKNFKVKSALISIVIFYAISFLFINVIWTGNARMAKLAPVVSLIYNEIFSKDKNERLNETELLAYGKSYQILWLKTEGDSLWEFPQKEKPLYRVPSEELQNSQQLKNRRAQKPNFIMILLESHRALNVDFLNSTKNNSTPFLDSLAGNSHIWERFHASGIPTTGGVLSTHIGIPHHSKIAMATELAHLPIPSFVSALRDSGYATHYFSAADPAWDNLNVWMAKWYNDQHYARTREDDSTFFKHAAEYINDTLASNNIGSPFFITLMTRSNHYPFNLAPGMPESEKAKPITERINYTMRWTDKQLSKFFHSIENEEWFANTYIIILADHGFPLGENGVSTMNGGAFSNVTWIPFLIYGNGIEAKKDTSAASQIDIAPTILELAGISVPNCFMGHNLLRGNGEGLSLGAYFGFSAIGLEGFRLISKFPYGLQNEESYLFADGDTRQRENLASENLTTVRQLNGLLDTLIRLSDNGLENP
ncbi:hypothetical protein AGMMS49938_11180 [Fibrobacterales bacterium]|nr:hypothetical protein AGMMS49938_11180 [Fibrobacterales bacterium]